MITLWGRLNSVNVQKVAWCLDEIGAPYERKEAGREFGVVGTPDYRAMNPNGLVPTLQDGGVVVWESNAILRYLCARFPHAGFWPADVAARAQADQWMDWQQTTLNKAIGPAFMNLVRTAPDKRDMAAVAASVAATEKAVALLDAALGASPWLGGGDFGMAEFAVAPHVHRWFNMDFARAERPNLRRWYDATMARPAAAAVLALPLT